MDVIWGFGGWKEVVLLAGGSFQLRGGGGVMTGDLGLAVVW